MVAQFAQLHPVWYSDLYVKYETRVNGDMKTRHGGETNARHDMNMFSG